MTNDEKFLEFKKNRRNKYIYLVLALVVIVLCILALFKIISFLWGLGVFGIMVLFKYKFMRKNLKNK